MEMRPLSISDIEEQTGASQLEVKGAVLAGHLKGWNISQSKLWRMWRFNQEDVDAWAQARLKSSCEFAVNDGKCTEFEIQAILFVKLKELGFDARGEVFLRKADETYVRADIVVFLGTAELVIECKTVNHGSNVRLEKQLAVYKNTITFPRAMGIVGMHQAMRLLELLKSMDSKSLAAELCDHGVKRLQRFVSSADTILGARA